MIRKYEKTDIDNIMKIWLETNILAHDFIVENYWIDNYEVVKTMLPEAEIFIYEENGNVEGFIGILNGEFIAGLFVSKESQKRGIGKKLLDVVKQKYDSLNLSVYLKNESAIRFYINNGFLISEEKIEEATKEIEYVMRWKQTS